MRTKVFYGILVVLMGSLILFGKCRAGEVDVSPMAQGELIWPSEETTAVYREVWAAEVTKGELIWPSEETTAEYSSPIYPIHRGSVTVIPDDITALLRECLEYIPDSSVVYNDPMDRGNYLTDDTLAIYRLRSAQTDADETADEAQAQANRVRAMADRLRAMTALHGKIKEMITNLEGRTK